MIQNPSSLHIFHSGPYSFIGFYSNNPFEGYCSSDGYDIDLKDLCKDLIPECPPGSKPLLNQRFNFIHEGFLYYKDYGRLYEFDVRQSIERNDKDGNTTIKYFVCSRSGRRDSKDQETEIQRRRTVSRKFECPVELFQNFVCV